MLRTVASPGTFRCHDRRFLLTINVLRLLIRRLTPTTTCGSPSPPAPRFCSEGRKRLTSPHWQGVARAKRAQRPLLRGESSGPQITPVWPKGGLTSALPLLEKLENLEIFWGKKKKRRENAQNTDAARSGQISRSGPPRSGQIWENFFFF